MPLAIIRKNFSNSGETIPPNINHETVNYSKHMLKEFKGRDQGDRQIFNDKRMAYDRRHQNKEIKKDSVFSGSLIQNSLATSREDSYFITVMYG